MNSSFPSASSAARGGSCSSKGRICLSNAGLDARICSIALSACEERQLMTSAKRKNQEGAAVPGAGAVCVTQGWTRGSVRSLCPPMRKDNCLRSTEHYEWGGVLEKKRSLITTGRSRTNLLNGPIYLPRRDSCWMVPCISTYIGKRF